ncbi:protein kinase-like domain, concanavalin A-like lectin/glucanase domain protein, partial [Tanacetum coccineum]
MRPTTSTTNLRRTTTTSPLFIPVGNVGSQRKYNHSISNEMVSISKIIMADGEIDNLTMEQYLALTRGNQAPGVVRPEIGGNVNFEIKSQFMRELKEDTFSGNKNDDAHKHVERVLDIVSLFNIPGVSHDVVMLRVFPITLTGSAKRWVDRLPLGTVDSWDLLKNAFIQRYCPPSKTAKQLEEIRNFKQEGDETYIKLGSGIMTYYINAPLMTSIAITRKIKSSRNSEGIAAIVNKLENLGRDMKKLKENVHAIQVGCQTCGGAHLDKDCPLNEEVKSVEEVKYGEFGRPFPNNNGNDDRFDKGGYDQPSSGERRPSLTEIINKYMEEASKRHAEQDEWLKNIYQRFSDNEKHETDNSGMAEALAALEATLKIKKEEPKEEKQS